MSSASSRIGFSFGAVTALLAAAGWWFLRPVVPAPPHVIELPSMAVDTAAVTHDGTELWVCAEPNALPFSNEAQEGFDNQIAALVAHDLNKAIRYQWRRQHPGASAMLQRRECDVVLGVPADPDGTATTQPYYRSAFVFVTRADRVPVRSFADPRLTRMTIGIQLTGDELDGPPARALAERELASQVRGYVANPAVANGRPARRIVDAVASGEIDIAAVWGPLAGYYAAAQPVRLVVTPVHDDEPSRASRLPFEFDIAIAVRGDQPALRDRIDSVLRERRNEIEALLRAYHVPLRSVTAASDGSSERGAL